MEGRIHCDIQMTKKINICRICQTENEQAELLAKETMYGGKDRYAYFECFNCGCIQQVSIIADPSAHYANKYYSLSNHHKRSTEWLKLYLHRLRASTYFNSASSIGKVLNLFFATPDIPDWVINTGIQFEEKMLDVGTGSGELLYQLARLGFRHLDGVDPFASHDVCIRGLGINIKKAQLHDIKSCYDLVMFHHSFEHLDDPLGTLAKAAQLTKPGKQLLIRIPVAGGYAWRTYGLDWIQFDAPRHIFLHTKKSIEILAEKTGLVLERVEYDSKAFQFWGSEQSKLGIPLFSDESHAVKKGVFSNQQIAHWERQSEELNAKRDGDQACFYLRKPLCLV